MVACAPSTRSFVASADAFVNQAAPGVNSGAGRRTQDEARLRAIAGELSHLHGERLVDPVTSVTLRLTSANYAGVDTVSAPDVHLLTASWSETGVTWATKPATGAVVALGGTAWGINTPL